MGYTNSSNHLMNTEPAIRSKRNGLHSKPNPTDPNVLCGLGNSETIRLVREKVFGT